MQAVILAAGKSTRTYPLTLTKPKPLLKVANKTLLEHNLENLKYFVYEVIIVVGYKKNLIKKYIGNRYKNLKIKYVYQKKQLGTANAVYVAKPYIKDRFVLLMGDDVYSKDDIKKCVKHKYAILTTRVKNPRNFGVVIEKNGILVDFIEKPKKFVSDLVSTALYSLDRKIFSYLSHIKKSERDEFEMPDAVKLLSKEEKVYCVKSKKWFPIVHAWDLLECDKMMRKNKNIIGHGSKINGSVKNSSIGNNCIIRGDVRNSIIMDKTIIDKDSIIEDSVIGENVYLKGIVLAKNNAYSIIKNEKIKINRLGAIIGDNSRLVNVEIAAGCKISPSKTIKNKKIEHDV